MSILEKLAKIEALLQGATSEGERLAAQLAKERVLTKILQDHANKPQDPANKPIEYKISHHSQWEKRLFVALCNKHGFHTYRYYRQKYTTTNVRISKAMLEEIIWPEYLRYSKMLSELVDGVMQDLIDKIHHVKEEETIIAGEIGTQTA